MRTVATSTGRGGLLVAASLWLAVMALAVMPGIARAQFFSAPSVPRPPADVPSAPPLGPQNLTAPDGGIAPPVAPRPAPVLPPPSPPPTQAVPSVPPGQVTLAVTARYGRDMPAISGGLHWRIFPTKPDQTGVFRVIREDKGPNPVFTLPPGGYIVSVGFGLASATKAVQLRENVREVVEIPAGGLRIEGKVGDVRIPPGQVSFDLFKGSQFEPGDKRPVAPSVMAGDVILVPEGIYHIVSKYGDVNSVVRSDIRVQNGKLTDVTVAHRAAIITLKLVNERGGEALANTQWTVLTPGGDIIKEVTGAFPRVILAEGDYRAIARNEDKSYERSFKVVNGVDGEVEVLVR